MYLCMFWASRYRLETLCMDSSWKNSRLIFFFSELSPLVKLGPFEKEGMNFVNAVPQKVLKLET